MTSNNATNNVQFTSINIVTFTSSGVYTPPQNLLWAQIECCGGGGGSGGIGAAPAGRCASSGGGGGGGYAKSGIAGTSLTPNVNVTIGNGGAAGAAGPNSGGTGGTTSFGAFVSATGGLGSAGSASNNVGIVTIGAAGGIGTAGDVQTRGGAGHNGFQWTNPLRVSGSGGDSCFGSGGEAVKFDASGIAGVFGGGGGGSAHCAVTGGSQPDRAGAAGGAGLCVITEYLSL